MRNISVTSSQDQLIELVTGLSQDDEFRARFSSNPEGVLREFNITVPPGTFPTPISLPSKQELQKAIDASRVGTDNPTFIAFIAFLAFLQK
jgi:putative modified peptide